MATILIVDDHVLNRDFLQTLLSYAGYRSLEAGSGEQALALLEQETPDLIIADLLMPNMDGYELIARIQAVPANAAIPIIIYTATFHEHEAKIIARACGAGWVLPKPSSPQAILQTVQEALGRTALAGAPPLAIDAHRSTPALPVQAQPLAMEPLVSDDALVLTATSVGGNDNSQGIGISDGVVASLANLQTVGLRLTQLIELGIELAAERDPARLVDTSAKAACKICHAEYASVGILDAPGKVIAHLGTHGLSQARRARLSYPALHSGVLGSLLATGKPQRLARHDGDPVALGLPASHPAVHALLGVPVISSINTIGWLYLVNNDGREFNEIDERVATTIASQLAVAYESVALVGQLKREMGERQHAQRLLHRTLRARTVQSACNHVMVHAADEPTLLRDMCRSIVEAGKYKLASIAYAHPDGALRPMAQAGEGNAAFVDIPGRTADQLDHDYGWGGAYTALQLGIARIVPDILLDTTLRAWHSEAIQLGLRASLSLPMFEQDRAFGILTIYESEAHTFDDEEVVLFQELANDIAYGVIGLRTKIARADAERALRKSQGFSQATIDALAAHILVLDEAGTILMVNRSLCDFCGRDPTGENYLAVAESTGGPTERDATAFADGIRAVMQNQVAQFTLEYPGSALLGEHWFHGKITRFGDDEQLRIVVAHEEITERKNHESHIEYLATHDGLTGLANRALLSDRLAQAIRQARRDQGRVALMFLDLDRFKNVNDSLGHAVGDLLLVAVADRLGKLVRREDSLARLGGDEFVILLARVHDPQNVSNIAAKIIEAFNTPFLIDGRQMYVSTSIGATIFPDDSDDIQTLYRNADTAMYRAKEASGNTFHFYSKDMSVRAIERSNLEDAMRQAIKCNEFELYYQPKASIETGKIVGAEALLRWNHPTLGMVLPSHFIPLAEETGLIVPIGALALQFACAENKAWQDAGLPPMCISVNLSARQFRQPELVEMIATILRNTGLDAQYLELELTESLVMGNAELFIEKLQALKAMGVQLAIDDFGTGYSSLIYLKRFPIDTLKIDREFIRDIATDPDDAAITRAVISLGQSMNLNVIAEGVETEAQLHYLAEHGCNQIQGYYISEPMPAAQFRRFQSKNQQLLPRPGAA